MPLKEEVTLNKMNRVGRKRESNILKLQSIQIQNRMVNGLYIED